MKYTYKYCVYKNNMCAGVMFVATHATLTAALRHKEHIQNNGGGCCDVVKKRFIAGQNKPTNNNIYNNTRYY